MSVPVLCKAEEIIVDTTDYNSDEAIESEEHLRITLEDTGGEYQTYQETQSITTTGASPRNRNNNNNNNGNIMSVTHHLITPSGKSGTKNMMENEKRMRREIANSNERRRMQSINAGFQSLRSLLPHHEGEKLSKAAILQQTAQYIVELEREKTHLLSQNSQLKRLVGQHEIGSVGGGGGGGGNDGGNIPAGGAIKKRKFAENIMTVQTISDSSDEGLGSMSPEPVTLISNATGATKTSTTVATAYLNVSSKELCELKTRLEAERSRRLLLEDRLRQLERQIYPSNQYIHREVIEHTDNLREEDIPMSFGPVQVVEIDSLPSVGQTQVVVCHSLEEAMQEEEEVISGDLITNVREEIVIGEESREYVELPSRLQPILEAAIKAEPKVEVERINSTLTKIKTDDTRTKDTNCNNNKQANSRRMLVTSTSRQNLETIVEAIRHLEGDHMFAENIESKKSVSPTTVTVTTQQQKTVAQENPLSLTTINKPITTTATISQQHQQPQRKLPVELTPFLQLKKQNGGGNTVTIIGSANTATLASNNSSSSNNSNNLNSSKILGTSSNSTSSCNIITLKTPQQAAAAAAAAAAANSSTSSSLETTTTTLPQHIRIAGVASLKQCRPGVIVAKQVS